MSIASRWLLAAVALTAGTTWPLAAQQREPVLRQVQVPHPYYWREMYVPQVTSGPSSASWSPDGRELVYAMQGTLWRQRPGDTVARQLTRAEGYDHQPDWSRRGRWIVYASYREDAVQLRLLDLTTGTTRPLVADGQVHVDPRFSPDGTRLAWVSTGHAGRWHVFVAPFDHATGTLGPAERITEDRDSGLPRYYYSPWDHYLSPTWGPDGRELILVSNRGRIWGTGGFWRMAARAGAPMRELWYEETTWKARPDWAPDGRRVVYAGYHGRQWHQLWLMTADGGDPFQLTYGDFDATAPRWSPDGTRIAYVSNQDGNVALQVVEIPGGRITRVDPRHREYAGPVGRLTVRVRTGGGGGDPVSSRVTVRDTADRSWAPDDAWRHADEAFVRGERGFEVGYFHADGEARLTLPPGRYTVEAWKGPEWSAARVVVEVPARGSAAADLVLDRIMDLPSLGWWGADLHVHMNYGGAYRNTPARLVFQAGAEGLHLVENLVVNKEQRIPDIEAFRPGIDPASTDEVLLAHGEEFHTSFWGHTALLGLERHFLLPNYAGYVNTAAASLVPTNTGMFREGRGQGAVTGYVHPFDTGPDPFDRTAALRHALPVDAALGTLDYLEVMGYSDHHATAAVWYRLLNTGFRIAAGAGTDAFPNFASLRGPPGLVRVYARAGERLEHRRFLDALRAGRTMATNGPLVMLRVRRPGEAAWHEPGDELALPAGRHRLEVHVSLRSNTPVDRLELIGNGRTLASIPPAGERTTRDTVIRVTMDRSGWLLVRAAGDRPREPILDLYPYATTSPVYVSVGGAPVRSAPDADFFIAWIGRVREEAARHEGWNTPAERTEVMTMLDAARAVFEGRRR